MLGDACGVGKTGQALLAIEKSWKVLIVCPATVKGQWQTAIREWCGLPSDIIKTSSDSIDKYQSNILIVNYDLIIRDKLLTKLLRKRFDVIIYDEAHKLKSLTAKRTKVALNKTQLRTRSERIWFLTGTPVKNRPIDIFPILKSCAPEILGKYQSYLFFAYRYCAAYQGPFGLVTNGASNIDELSAKLNAFMLRREKRDVLTELPPRSVTLTKFEYSEDVKQIIQDEVEKTMEIAGDRDPSRFLLGEQVRIRKAVAQYKLPNAISYIKDLLEDEEKIVVFYYHKHVLAEMLKALKDYPSVFVDGGVDSKKRPGIVNQFIKDDKLKLFFGQMEACGEGIDGLQHATSHCVFVEPSWSHTDMEQCIGRLERSGQKNNITIHILVIKDTIEDHMLDIVKEKLETDRILYDQKEASFMAKAKEVTDMDKVVSAIEKLTKVLEKILDKDDSQVRPPTNTNVLSPAEPRNETPVYDEVQREEVVETETADDITDEAIRLRAGDICAISSDGTGKTRCIEIIKEVGGGKIVDLKTPAQRKLVMKKFDELYNELAG